MYDYRDDEVQLFDLVEKKIAHNGRKLIRSLNDNWRLLGVDDPTRQKRTEALVKIVQERYDEVLEETLEKIKVIKLEIENLKTEAVQLSERLSMEIKTPSIKKDTPLSVVKEALENDLERYRKLIATRVEHLTQLNSWQQKLCHMLGCSSKDLPDCPLPTEEALEDLTVYLRAQEKEYEKRVQIFLKKQDDIKHLLAELEEEPQDSFHYYVVKSSYMDFRVTDQNMTKLDIVCESLHNQFQQKETKVLEMRERLTVLWERLEESPEYRMNFLADYPGHSRATQAALEVELQRCEEKKRQSFKLFVSKVRTEIVDMWEKCLYSDLQREKFVEFYSNVFNEDLLMLHEIYLDELKVFYKDNKDIFDMYAVRQQLWTKWSELEARANEPGRFHNRGGQLLREEKERKTVSNQLPKIEAELTQLVELYESRTGSSFFVNGESLLMCMQNDWNQKNLERKNKLSARKQPGPVSAPRSAPPARHVANFSSRAALTAVKRRLSPRQSPQVSKSRLLPRRLQLSPSPASPAVPSQEEAPQAKKFKGPLPSIAVNGYLLKKKKIVGRRSGESKNKRRSRKSRSNTSIQLDAEKQPNMPDDTLASYIHFQEHLHDNSASRSSIVPRRTLRTRTFNPQASSSVYMPDGQITPKEALASQNSRKKEASKENAPPFNAPNILSPKAHLYACNTFGATPMANRCKPAHNLNAKTPDAKNARNVDLFATPRPVTKAKSSLLLRQNTVALASPADRTRPMLRSSSSHNLRANSPSFAHQSSKLQLASKLPLII